MTTATLPAITREPLTIALFDELRPLIEANHKAANVDGPLDFQPWVLQGMQPQVWVVRDDGKAVGYCAHIIAPNPITAERWAVCLAIYVDPKHRALARALVKQIEHDVRGDVVVVTYSVPHLSNAGAFLEVVCEYQCRELVMAKRIG